MDTAKIAGIGDIELDGQELLRAGEFEQFER
jgi:hypothetical protein